jgi:hypothetical protein
MIGWLVGVRVGWGSRIDPLDGLAVRRCLVCSVVVSGKEISAGCVVGLWQGIVF